MKDAILIIPGMEDLKIGQAVERVSEKIMNRQTLASVRKIDEPNQLQKRYELNYHEDKKTKVVDLIELYWGDIIKDNDPTKLSIGKKFFFGMELITFWWKPRIWKSVFKNKLLFTAMFCSGIIVLLWFISISGLFFTAMLHNETFAEFIKDTGIQEGVNKLLTYFEYKDLEHKDGVYFAYLTIGLGLVPTTALIRCSGFAMKYIKSNIIRDTVKLRIHKKMQELLNKNEYNSITLFCHSLGALPTINYLADIKTPNKVKIKCISIGAPLSFLAHNSPQIRQSIQGCFENENIASWKDFFSKKDWFCAYEEVDARNEHFYSKQLEMDNSWMARFTGKTHVQYFEETTVINELIGPSPSL